MNHRVIALNSVDPSGFEIRAEHRNSLRVKICSLVSSIPSSIYHCQTMPVLEPALVHPGSNCNLNSLHKVTRRICVEVTFINLSGTDLAAQGSIHLPNFMTQAAHDVIWLV